MPSSDLENAHLYASTAHHPHYHTSTLATLSTLSARSPNLPAMDAPVSSKLQVSMSQTADSSTSSPLLPANDSSHQLSTVSTHEPFEGTPTPKPRNYRPFLRSLGHASHDRSSYFKPPTLTEISASLGTEHVTDPDPVNLEEFDLKDFTEDEIRIYNSMAEPGQRLQDTMTPNTSPPKRRKTSGELSTTTSHSHNS